MNQRFVRADTQSTQLLCEGLLSLCLSCGGASRMPITARLLLRENEKTELAYDILRTAPVQRFLKKVKKSLVTAVFAR